ncbi:MAG: RpiB/LacA/LacB family sugar-phosphate isomerase, partial [Campylobacteraceae bacterium]|nr:RpiB/LacA/LacB family sugar-phosphate isomerase [Campylobacteraceae bacterium]
MIKDKNIKFYIANDHAGMNIKNVIVDYLASQNCYEIINLGTDSNDCVDYTDYAHLLAQKVSEDSKCFG